MRPKIAYFYELKSKSKSKYLLKAYDKRIRTVQCGYMQIESITKTLFIYFIAESSNSCTLKT